MEKAQIVKSFSDGQRDIIEAMYPAEITGIPWPKDDTEDAIDYYNNKYQ